MTDIQLRLETIYDTLHNDDIEVKKDSPNKFRGLLSKLLFKGGKKLLKKLKNKKTTTKKVKENKPLPASHPEFIRKSLKKQLSEPI